MYFATSKVWEKRREAYETAPTRPLLHRIDIYTLIDTSTAARILLTQGSCRLSPVPKRVERKENRTVKKIHKTREGRQGQATGMEGPGSQVCGRLQESKAGA